MKTILAAGLILAAAPACAQDFESSNTLPFSYSIISVEDVMRAGEAFTVATLRIENGSSHVRSIEFSCEAGNAGGYTWDVRGAVSNVRAGERREFRIVSTGGEPEYFAKANRLHCAVASFTSAL